MFYWTFYEFPVKKESDLGADRVSKMYAAGCLVKKASIREIAHKLGQGYHMKRFLQNSFARIIHVLLNILQYVDYPKQST